MLIRILYFIFVVVLVRFIASLVRSLFSAGSPQVDKRKTKEERINPKRGEKVIDVEFTEHPHPDPSRKGAR